MEVGGSTTEYAPPMKSSTKAKSTSITQYVWKCIPLKNIYLVVKREELIVTKMETNPASTINAYGYLARSENSRDDREINSFCVDMVSKNSNDDDDDDESFVDLYAVVEGRARTKVKKQQDSGRSLNRRLKAPQTVELAHSESNKLVVLPLAKVTNGEITNTGIDRPTKLEHVEPQWKDSMHRVKQGTSEKKEELRQQIFVEGEWSNYNNEVMVLQTAKHPKDNHLKLSISVPSLSQELGIKKIPKYHDPSRRRRSGLEGDYDKHTSDNERLESGVDHMVSSSNAATTLHLELRSSLERTKAHHLLPKSRSNVSDQKRRPSIGATPTRMTSISGSTQNDPFPSAWTKRKSRSEGSIHQPTTTVNNSKKSAVPTNKDTNANWAILCDMPSSGSAHERAPLNRSNSEPDAHYLHYSKGQRRPSRHDQRSARRISFDSICHENSPPIVTKMVQNKNLSRKEHVLNRLFRFFQGKHKS